MARNSKKKKPARTSLEKLSVAQKVVIYLAIPLLLAAGKSQRLSLFIPAIVLGVVAVLLWLARRLYERNLYKKAMHLAEQGEHMASLGLLIMAEEAWVPNELHDTPRTLRKDFRRLAMIIAAIQAEVHKLGGELDTEELMKVVLRYVDVCSNKKNMAFGTNSLKASANRELMQLGEIFLGLRARFRAAYQEFYEASDRRPASGLYTHVGP